MTALLIKVVSVFLLRYIKQRSSKMIIGELYRPPNHDVDKFNVSFNTLLTKLEKENAKFLLAGDYNINLINDETHKGSENFLNQLFFHLCLPSITKPTRFTSISSTLIDNIIYDLKPLFNSISDVKSGLLISDVANHLPIFHLSEFYIDVNHNTVKPRYI